MPGTFASDSDRLIRACASRIAVASITSTEAGTSSASRKVRVAVTTTGAKDCVSGGLASCAPTLNETNTNRPRALASGDINVGAVVVMLHSKKKNAALGAALR